MPERVREVTMPNSEQNMPDRVREVTMSNQSRICLTEWERWRCPTQSSKLMWWLRFFIAWPNEWENSWCACRCLDLNVSSMLCRWAIGISLTHTCWPNKPTINRTCGFCWSLKLWRKVITKGVRCITGLQTKYLGHKKMKDAWELRMRACHGAGFELWWNPLPKSMHGLCCRPAGWWDWSRQGGWAACRHGRPHLHKRWAHKL